MTLSCTQNESSNVWIDVGERERLYGSLRVTTEMATSTVPDGSILVCHLTIIRDRELPEAEAEGLPTVSWFDRAHNA